MVKLKGQVVRRRQPQVEKIKIPRHRRDLGRGLGKAPPGFLSREAERLLGVPSMSFRQVQPFEGAEQTPDEFFAEMGLQQKPKTTPIKQVKKPIRTRGSRLRVRTPAEIGRASCRERV